MGWTRAQYRKVPKHPRHTHVPLCVARCSDCGRELVATHQVSRFGTRCRPCFSTYSLSVVDARFSPVVWLNQETGEVRPVLLASHEGRS